MAGTPTTPGPAIREDRPAKASSDSVSLSVVPRISEEVAAATEGQTNRVADADAVVGIWGRNASVRRAPQGPSTASLKSTDWSRPLADLGRPPAAASARLNQAQRSILVPLLNARQRLEHGLLVALWLGAMALFWEWWFIPHHNLGTSLFLLNTIPIAWTVLLPLYFIAMVVKCQVCDPAIPLPAELRVAMVVTKAPSEPFEVVQETLEAMLKQSHPHDTWLADEDPTQEVFEWCAARGIKVSTRKGRSDYHRPVWPRRTRCKEGNLAFFYDHYGYENYDVVVQLDADHVPEPGYLEEMLRPFADPQIGYVSAPSICDTNASDSWSARARLHVEAPVHGPLQAGYTGGFASLCIGSHYAVRTRALKQIGGLGPELAEDHSTTLMMNAAGWRGVHAINAIAHGYGPRTFGDFATQEFQWARSLMTIFLQYTPAYIRSLPLHVRFQFLFCQLWYPLFSLMAFLMYCLPIIALMVDVNFVRIVYAEFFLRVVLMSLIMVTIIGWWRAQGWTRPIDTKVLSWEGMLCPFAKWPWTLLGVLAAINDCVRGRTAEFRVTPKGSRPADPLPLRLILPYLLLSILSAIPVMVFDDIHYAKGFYIFAALNSAIYATLLLVIVRQHARENPQTIERLSPSLLRPQLGAVALVIAVLLVAGASMERRLRDGVPALLWGADCLIHDCSQPARLRAAKMPEQAIPSFPNWQKGADHEIALDFGSAWAGARPGNASE